MFFAGFLTVAMLCSARFWLEFVWGLRPCSYEFTILIGLIFMELMILLFTTRWWSEFCGEGPWNLVQNTFIIPVGLAVTFGIIPYLVLGVMLSLVFYDLRFILVRVEAILYCFLIGAPVNRVGRIYGKHARIVFLKHWSFVDIIMFAAIYPGRRWSAVSKLLMLFIIPFTPFLLLQGIMLRRKKGKATRSSVLKVMAKAAHRLGVLEEDILIYPEGHRSWGLKRFQDLMAHLALENQAPLTPIAITFVKPYVGKYGIQTQPACDAVIGYDIHTHTFNNPQELNECAHSTLERMLEEKK